MRLARYVGAGRVVIVDEPAPACPDRGLLVRTEACGLCSGELVAWYMDRKVPHVLGHEVAGIVEESGDERYPVGRRVFPHHHAPCLRCSLCRRGAHVHCPTWRATRLVPGGMAERFAVPAENLNDTILADDLRAVDAALIEPLACVAKSLRLARLVKGERLAVVGLGAMGLMHLLAHGAGAGCDANPRRREWAAAIGLDARPPDAMEAAEVVVVCPGTEAALQSAVELAAPGGRIVLFAPMPPGAPTPVRLHDAYFRDLSFVSTYSCGPDDTRRAAAWLREGRVRAEQIVSHFLDLDELPRAYEAMRAGEIVKAMVVFPSLGSARPALALSRTITLEARDPWSRLREG